MAMKLFAALYGLLAYAAFFLTILWAIGFLAGFDTIVPATINSGVEGPVGLAILVNVLLLGLFAVQHTIMARPGFKVWWTKIIPKALERSTFVLVASLILALIFWQWRPITGLVWDVDNAAARALVVGICFFGWFMVFYSSFLIDHFDLFGLRQVFLFLKGIEYSHLPFKSISLYKYVRHPLMLGFMIAFWATPTMTYGHLLFAVVTTAYIFFGIHLEERDLKRLLNDDYRRYREETPMIFPVGLKPSVHEAPHEKAT